MKAKNGARVVYFCKKRDSLQTIQKKENNSVWGFKQGHNVPCQTPCSQDKTEGERDGF